jgi:hypothetical protein
MKNIFQITQEAQEIASILEEGEFTPEIEKRLAITAGELETKAANYAHVIKSIEGDLITIDAEIKRLQALKSGKTKVIDRMKEAVTTAMVAMQMDRIETPIMKLFFRKSEAVEIEDENLVPDEYKISRVVVNPDKIQIKKLIQRGEEVPGCRVVEKLNLQIK